MSVLGMMLNQTNKNEISEEQRALRSRSTFVENWKKMVKINHMEIMGQHFSHIFVNRKYSLIILSWMEYLFLMLQMFNNNELLCKINIKAVGFCIWKCKLMYILCEYKCTLYTLHCSFKTNKKKNNNNEWQKNSRLIRQCTPNMNLSFHDFRCELYIGKWSWSGVHRWKKY